MIQGGREGGRDIHVSLSHQLVAFHLCPTHSCSSKHQAHTCSSRSVSPVSLTPNVSSPPGKENRHRGACPQPRWVRNISRPAEACMQGSPESAFHPRPFLMVGVWERKLRVLKTDEAPIFSLGSGTPTSPLALIRPLSPPISSPQQICFSNSLKLQGEAESLDYGHSKSNPPLPGVPSTTEAGTPRWQYSPQLGFGFYHRFLQSR